MDGVTLLEQARLAGLTVIVQGGKLVIRGPAGPPLLPSRCLPTKVKSSTPWPWNL